jgi:peptidoglycan/xylan/chitin deacetylase (PgdA/CDA1 family)
MELRNSICTRTGLVDREFRIRFMSIMQSRVQGGEKGYLARRSSRPIGLILMYHRVRNTSYDPWKLAVTPEQFEQHLAVLSHQKVVPLRLLHRDPGAIAVTFDDGYLDNLEVALPLLEKYRIPATMFVATDAFSAREFWWDRLDHAFRRTAGSGARGLSAIRLRIADRLRPSAMGARLRSLDLDTLELALGEIPGVPAAGELACPEHRMMNESQVVRLAASPLIEIGAHTCSHPCLPQLREDSQYEEMCRSRAILEQVTGRSVRTFAYPYGAHDDTTIRAAKRAGFDLACIVGGGLLRSDTDPFKVPRLQVRPVGGVAFRLHIGAWRALRWLA